MKRIFIIWITTFLIFNTVYAEESNDAPALPELEQSQTEGKEEPRYTPAGQMEETGELLFTPAAEELLYSPVREPEKPRGIFHADVTTAFQVVDLDTHSSKAQEYRKLTDGFFIKSLSLDYETQDQEFSSSFTNIAPLLKMIDDAHGELNYRRYGIIDVHLGMNKFPHSYTDDPDVSTQRDNYDLHVRLTPGERLTVTTSLKVENMNGKRPITLENLTASSETPTAITEITESTDFTTTSFAIGLEYTDSHIDMQFNNSVQMFTNTQADEIIWNNPWQTGAFGRAKAADDYTVHTLLFKPSLRLSDNVRLVNSLSYSKVTHSISLAPFTTVEGVGDPFQKDVLDPDVRSLNVSSTLTTMPLPDLRLNVKYRYYAYENDTPEIDEMPAYVMLDGSSTKYSRIPRYTSIITRSLGIDGNWYLSDRLSLDAGIEDKGNPRREREVEDENVKSLFLTIHSSIYDNLSGQAGYRYERKRGGYDPTYYKTIYDPLSDVDQHRLMRAFDLSESDTHSAKAGIHFSPSDILNLSASLSIKMGEHIDVLIGRRSSQTESASLSAELTPSKELLLYSHYFHDTTTIESRYSWTYDSTLTASYPQETNPLFSGFIKPVSESIEDASNSYVIGFDYEASEKISVTGNYNRQDITGTTVTMPAVSSTTDTYELKISYRPDPETYHNGFSSIRLKDLRISAGYYSETYKRNDYALDNIPATPDIIVVSDPQDIFLGVTEPDYRLNIFSLTLAFYF